MLWQLITFLLVWVCVGVALRAGVLSGGALHPSYQGQGEIVDETRTRPTNPEALWGAMSGERLETERLETERLETVGSTLSQTCCKSNSPGVGVWKPLPPA